MNLDTLQVYDTEESIYAALSRRERLIEVPTKMAGTSRVERRAHLQKRNREGVIYPRRALK